VRYIDARKGRWGVEPICRALQFAPSTYYATKARLPSARQVTDETLKPEILRVHESNCDGVYGAKKIWKQLHREGIDVANCTVRRLMKDQGLSGARRGRQFKITTISDENQHRPSDLVDRQFVAPAPNRLWVADLTYVKTHTGWTYVAFIIDVFSRAIVGWQASTSLRSDLAIDALEMAIYARNEHDLSGLVHHSDRGVQGEFNRSLQHLNIGGVNGKTIELGQGVLRQVSVEVARSTVASQRGSETLLARDRQGLHERRGSRSCRSRTSSRVEMVPAKWRHAIT